MTKKTDKKTEVKSNFKDVYYGEYINCWEDVDNGMVMLTFYENSVSLMVPKDSWEPLLEELKLLYSFVHPEREAQILKEAFKEDRGDITQYTLQSYSDPSKVIKILDSKKYDSSKEQEVIDYFKQKGQDCLVIWDYELENPEKLKVKSSNFVQFGSLCQA
jgi:hypothetical protein